MGLRQRKTKGGTQCEDVALGFVSFHTGSPVNETVRQSMSGRIKTISLSLHLFNRRRGDALGCGEGRTDRDVAERARLRLIED